MFKSKDRTENYKREVKSVWDGHYERNIWRTVHQARTEEDNIKLAAVDLDLFLFPTVGKCIKHYNSVKEKFGIIPTFSKDFGEYHKSINDYFSDVSKCTALDYGCGSLARYTTNLAKHFKKVIGIDSSPKAIKYCKRYTDKFNNIQIIETDGVSLKEIEDGSVDFVFSNLVFQHIGNKEIILDLIEEMYRVLKPFGVMRASFYTEEKPDDYQDAYHGTGFSLEGYKQVFENAGFIVETQTHVEPVMWITVVKGMERSNE